MALTVKFNRYYVTNGTTKARVHYSLDNRVDRRACVTIYARDYGHALAQATADLGVDYKNDTDMMTDYFDKGRVVVFEEHPHWAEIRARVETLLEADRAAWAARDAKRLARRRAA